MKQTRSMILAALFAALTAVGAFIRIPTPVSAFTLQVFFAAMAGALLGRKWGMASQLIYVALGLVGLPIFTSGGGPGALLHPTAGFLLGLLPMAWLIGVIVERHGAAFHTICLACLAGLVVLYAIGLPYLHLILRVYLQQSWSVRQTLQSGLLLFLPWDLLKVLMTGLLCVRIYPAVHRIL